MATSEQYFDLVRTSKSSWVAVPINRTSPAAASTREPEPDMLRSAAPVQTRLFAQATGSQARFSERFPRLTIAMIAGLLFTASVAAEVEMLRNAGYFWK
jgi:hypothetical protein